MYRILILLVLINISEPRHHKKHHKHKCWNINDHADVLLEKLGDEVIAADKKAQDFCKAHNSQVMEQYSADNYKLIVPLKDFNVTNITVKVKHRVIYFKVQRKNEDKDHKDTFEEVVIMPDIVNSKQALWSVIDAEIVVTMPYKFITNTAVKKYCDVEFDYDTINVPRA